MPCSSLARLAGAAALLLALGCSSAAQAQAAPPGEPVLPGPSLPGEVVLERGGELGASWPQRSLELTGEVVRVWGISEVPDGSRLQLALSGVDAITRAELLKAVRVRVQSVLMDAQRADSQQLSLSTTESVAGVLDRAGPLPHGWARIRRGEQVVLRLWARLEVPRSALEAALRAPLASTGTDAHGFVTGLELSTPEGTAP